MTKAGGISQFAYSAWGGSGTGHLMTTPDSLKAGMGVSATHPDVIELVLHQASALAFTGEPCPCAPCRLVGHINVEEWVPTLRRYADAPNATPELKDKVETIALRLRVAGLWSGEMVTPSEREAKRRADEIAKYTEAVRKAGLTPNEWGADLQQDFSDLANQLTLSAQWGARNSNDKIVWGPSADSTNTGGGG